MCSLNYTLEDLFASEVNRCFWSKGSPVRCTQVHRWNTRSSIGEHISKQKDSSQPSMCFNVHCHSPRSGLKKKHLKTQETKKTCFGRRLSLGTNSRNNCAPILLHRFSGFCCGGPQVIHRPRGKSLKLYQLVSQSRSTFLSSDFVCLL